MREKVLVIDFGGQYNQLIARRVREQGVYCEILPYKVGLDRILKEKPVGIIFTGGPKNVYAEDAPKFDAGIFKTGIPMLGICYGAQFIAHGLGGEVSHAERGEYGKANIEYTFDNALFKDMQDAELCWMSHMDYVSKLPDGFETLAKTQHCPHAAFCDKSKKIYAVQFHPEVMHTQKGTNVLKNFLYDVCGCAGGWTMSNLAVSTVEEAKRKIGDGKVLLGLSGGVDSSVAAVILSKAVGKNLTCILVDHGLLRKNEADEVEELFCSEYDMTFIRVNAQERFLTKLAGVSDPETKRKIIGEEFVRVFEEEAKKIGHVEFMAQGTIYPDVIESGLGDSAVIKSHHNVGGLPKDIDFDDVIEPLVELFKDEVRALGQELGLPAHMVNRQPFPGPGLAIRIIGDVTSEKIEILQEADYIFRDEIARQGLDQEIWQYFAVLTGMRSVGVMGDERTYDYTIALRAVTSVDGMTADWARIPFDVLQSISARIVNEASHINRIVYDITSKPPATIEWE